MNNEKNQSALSAEEDSFVRDSCGEVEARYIGISSNRMTSDTAIRHEYNNESAQAVRARPSKLNCPRNFRRCSGSTNLNNN